VGILINLKIEMKKLAIYAFSAAITLLMSCRDESLNPNKPWEPGVHAFGAFADVTEPAANAPSRPHAADFAKNFPLTGQDAATAGVNFRVRWVSLDNKVTVNKVEIFVDMIEAYNDPDGNPKTVSLGNGGVLLKTINPAAANRQWSTFSVTPKEVSDLFKNATVKYDRVNAVSVFNNPARPRLTGSWIKNNDRIIVTWRLTTTDGLVFRTWNPESICLDVTPYSQAASNCQLVFGAR
jgi:hypothetical protein